ncbi:MAG TPA: DUF1178 family protein [Gammaproteobacteria bacterium]|nr:DUF1178 family protein [Gammaproteobacteria bacterium]
MIIFNLKCDSEHHFEGWFKNKAEFDRQMENSLVSCPQCGSDSITKTPTASRINKLSTKSNSEQSNISSVVSPQEIKMIAEQFIEKLSDYVEENFTYVGKDFPEEARKIYYGETDVKNIYGQATQNEIKSLNEEGVSTVTLPFIPVEKDKLN